MARPNRDILKNSQNGGGSATRTGGTYISPYSRNKVSPGAPPNRLNVNGSGSRGRVGNTSTGRNSGKFVNSNYTPPVRKPYVSPGVRSNGSSKATPNVTMTN